MPYTFKAGLCLASFVVLMSSCAHGKSDASACDSWPDKCLTSDNILVLAKPDIAAPILAAAKNSQTLYRAHFGQSPAPIAIVPDQSISADLESNLRAAGFPSNLPWISSSDRQLLKASAIRQQIEAQLKDAPKALKDAALEQALQQIKSQSENTGSSEMEKTEHAALSHEIGHIWFMHDFFKSADDPEAASGKVGGHIYGGAAPDWLDETAAILLETGPMPDSRREHFKTMPAGERIKLETFLQMEHPALAAAISLDERAKSPAGKAGEGESRVTILTGKEGEAFLKASGGADAVNFYAQVRVFADFIMETTGDSKIFANLAKSLSSGESFENWLSKGQSGLEKTVPELSAQWDNWLAQL